MKAHHFAELTGIAVLLGATATQLFYLEPLKREIEWRLVAFNVQQAAQVQSKATFDTRVELLKAINAPADRVSAAEADRDATLAKFKTADANISDYLIEKENVEGYLEIILIALFGVGTLLAGIGRLLEIQAQDRGG